jgi:AcrR family transcriptional regulator
VPKVSEAHQHSRRRQILDAAIECFARRGFQRTSMGDIIRESNLSVGAIYSYFQSKDQIIETLADERHDREKQLIQKAVAREDWTECLRLLVKSFYESLEDPRERKERRLGIHLWAEALCNPRVLHLIRRGINQPLELLSQAIAKAQSEAKLRKDIDAEAAGRVLIALFHGFILQQAWEDRADVAAFARAALSIAQVYFSPHPIDRRARVRQLRPR